MSATVEHLSSYPSVSQVVSFAKSFSVVQKAGSISKPYVDTIAEKTAPITSAIYNKAQPTLAKADELGDKFLSNLDSKFPAIKTAQPSDLVSEVRHRIDGAKASVGNTANSVKSKYSQVYDTNGKPYVDGIGSRIAPLNDKLDGAIESYLPTEGEATEAEKTASSTTSDSSELSRTYSLVIKLVGRLKPAAFGLRDSTLSHVQSVYGEKLQSQSPVIKDLSINVLGKPVTIKLSYSKDVAAALKTGFALGYESYAKLFEVVSGSPTGKKVRDTLDAASEHVSEAVEAVSSAAGDAKSDAKSETASIKKRSKAKVEKISQEAQAAVY